MDKKELRRFVKSRVASLSAAQREVESAAVWAAVESLPEFAAAAVVLTYMSLPDELPTWEVVRRWHEAGKRVVLPRVISESGMELREYCPDRMVSGAFGILEPGVDCPSVDPSEVGIAIVPGLAFDRTGMRLGRGKGYYDRLLPLLHCPLVGVCYSVSVVDEVPGEAWDVSMDKVIYSGYEK